MANLRLTIACGPYDRTQALIDGSIKPDGIDLTYLTLQPAEIFWRMLQFQEFDDFGNVAVELHDARQPG